MNILLLNLTRFGDLLQSQAAIHDLARDGHRVGVVCLENFSGAAELLSGVAGVFPFRGSALLRNVAERATEHEAGQDAPSWHAALADLAAWRDALRQEFAPDVICNLTPSLAARMLTLFVAGEKPCWGFSVDGHGFGVNGNAWAGFLQGASASRRQSPFNVVDVFRRIASPASDEQRRRMPGDAALRPLSPDRLAGMQADLREQAPEGCAGFAALQLGASEDRRRWPVASFAALGEMLWREEKLCPVLLGSKAERPLAESYAVLADHPFLDLCGKTGLEELACVLGTVKILISNDTGTMHLAAGLGIPVLGIFLATAQPFDTGPYLAGSCCLEPDMDCHPCGFGSACGLDEACRRAVSADLTAKLALSRLRTGQWKVPEGSGARIWLSRHDEQGFMSLVSLSGHENEARTLWLSMQRHFLRAYLDRDPGKEFRPTAFSASARLPLAEREAILGTLQQTASLTGLLIQQGQVLMNRPLPLMRDRFLSTWQKVHDLLRGNSWCGSLALLWAQETQAEGQDLPVILKLAEQFRQLLLALCDGLHQ